MGRKCKSKCFCPTGPTGAAGRTGPTGFTGATGPGSNALLINKSIFVDTQYGNDATGVKDNEARPFQTLAAALALALPGDTIYVQPGIYNENNLTLLDNVDWYFTQGSSIVTTGLIFNDNAGLITSTISGYGSFASSTGILSIVNNSNVNFTANSADAAGSFAFFVNNGILDLNLDSITSSATVFLFNGNTTFTANVDTITSTNRLMEVTANATGQATLVSNDANVNSSISIFSFLSNDFFSNISINSLIATTTDYLINLNVPTALTTSQYPTCNNAFNFQSLYVTGGLVLSSGDSSLINLPADFNHQPTVSIRSQTLYVESTSTAFDISYSSLKITCDYISHNVSAPYVFSSVSGIIIVAFHFLSFSYNSVSTGLAITTGGSVFTLFGQFIFNQGIVINGGPGSSCLIKLCLLYNRDFNGVPSSSFLVNGASLSVIINESFYIIGPDFPVSGNHIEVNSGTFSITFNNILYLGGNSNFVYCALGATASMLGNILNPNVGGTSNVFSIFGTLNVDIGIVECNGPNFLLLDTAAQDSAVANLKIGSVRVNSQGYLVTSNNGILNAYIGSINVNGGAVLVTTGGGSSYLTFNNIQCNGNGTNVLLLESAGLTCLRGNSLNINSYSNPFVVGTSDVLLSFLRLSCQDININNSTTGFSLFGNLYLISDNISVNNVSSDLFLTAANSSLRVNILTLFNQSQLNSSNFRINGAFTGYISELNTNCAALIQEDGQINLTYDVITCISNQGTLSTAFQFASPNNVNAMLKGGVITIDNCTTGFTFNAGSNVWIKASNITLSNINDGFVVNSNVYITSDTINYNNGNNSLATVQSGLLQYNVGTINVNSTPTQVFLVNDPGNMNAVIDYLTAGDSIVLNLNTSGVVRYSTKSSVIGNAQIATIVWPNPSTHQLDGYFSTGNVDVVTISGVVVGGLRLFGAILANPSGSFSIDNLSGIPMNIITQNTIATNPVSVDVNVIPLSGYTTDPAIY